MTPFFWEDAVQAQERLQGSYVLYGDEPVFIEQVNSRRSDVVAMISRCVSRNIEEVSLSSPLFHMFRKLPILGWINDIEAKKALFLDRQSTRSRTHGFVDNNIRVGNTEEGSDELYFRNYRFSTIAVRQGYFDANKGNYPSLPDVLSVIRNNSIIAVSNKFAVKRDQGGLRWLYHGMNKIGVFTDTETLLLVTRFSFMKEEIQETPNLLISNVREF